MLSTLFSGEFCRRFRLLNFLVRKEMSDLVLLTGSPYKLQNNKLVTVSRSINVDENDDRTHGIHGINLECLSRTQKM
jgi:hypothetical protein